METNLTQEILEEFLDYDPETGVLTWKPRDLKWFKNEHGYRVFNAKIAGKIAGCVKNFNGKLYSQIKIFGVNYLSHRLIWLYRTGEWPDEVDHEDGNGLHNWWSNLRNVTHQENERNQRKPFHNTSGVCGVVWDIKSHKWNSRIGINNKKENLGYFDDFFDAVAARKSAEIKYGFHPNHGQARPL